MKKIEVIGAGFINKGAELMVHAIYEQVNQNLPTARLVLPANKNCPYEERVAFGAYQKISFKRNGIDFGNYAQKCLPKLLKRYIGLIDDNEIDILFDASGFAYSDQWGINDTLVSARYFKKLKSMDKKIILLPQAFGPFTSTKLQERFKDIVKYSDLIFPRDDISYKYVVDLVGEQEKIIQAPDFTNLLTGFKPSSFNGNENRICIIPNYRMIDMVSDKNSSTYIPLITKIINYVLNKGENPFFLIHEGEKDLYLANEINKNIKQSIDIIQESNPLAIKGILKECKGVIGSRFHGLVSSLSQATPTLAIGWSHKYDMLFKDYAFPEGSIAIDISNDKLEILLEKLVDKHQSNKLRTMLSISSLKQKELSLKMWDKVFSLVEKNSI